MSAHICKCKNCEQFYTLGIQAQSLSTGTQVITDTLYWKTDMEFGILNAPSIDGMILKCEISGS